MKNPLRKRILRELKNDFSKYLVIFLFMVLLISVVSAFLVADISVTSAYNKGFKKFNIEDGHMAFNKAPTDKLIQSIEDKANIKLYDLQYFEAPNDNSKANIRVYKDRETVNREDLMEGKMPSKDNEIALDRMYARNADIKVGDTISLDGRQLTVSGLIAVPDYSCLFEKNSDMMFDSINFSIAVMTSSGYEAFDSKHITYNYAWQYETDEDIEDEAVAAKLSEDLIDSLQTILINYNIQDFMENGDPEIINTIMSSGIDFSKFNEEEIETLIAEYNIDVITLEDYLPRYENSAINFTGEDMGSDKAMVIMFDYIVTAILAFVFAVTISNTITKESGVIGTLRASGFTKGEMIRHYMILPFLVSIVAAAIGNIIGYTFLKEYMVGMYYNSYSLCSYKTLWSAEAFVLTTVVPVVLMMVINYVVLATKLKLSPLRFLRHDLSKKGKKKAFRLNTKIPIMTRFRLRIIFQNIPNYITLFVGICLASLLYVFGSMFVPLLRDYADLVVENRISDYQYVLMGPAETKNSSAEKYCITNLKTMNTDYKVDEVGVYGVIDNSKYITANIEKGKVLVSNGMAEKFGLSQGDKLKLQDPYTKDVYEFVVGGEYRYDAALTVFMPQEDFNKMFKKSADYYSGYFSNEELEDITNDDIAARIGIEDLTKISDQLEVSMTSFMVIFRMFAIILFVLLMFLLGKQIVEKNANSIAMTKILGYSNGEIAGLYIVSTTMVVLLALLVSIPIGDIVLRIVFKTYLYQEMTGYIPYIVSNTIYVKMFMVGVLSYAATAVLQFVKIGRIPKSDALKNVE